jgi:hypothetical protein
MVVADRAGDFSGDSNRRGASRDLFEAAAPVKKPVPCVAQPFVPVPLSHQTGKRAAVWAA